jgi:hypothetical protein
MLLSTERGLQNVAMPAWGHSATMQLGRGMSALLLKADIDVEGS